MTNRSFVNVLLSAGLFLALLFISVVPSLAHAGDKFFCKSDIKCEQEGSFAHVKGDLKLSSDQVAKVVAAKGLPVNIETVKREWVYPFNSYKEVKIPTVTAVYESEEVVRVTPTQPESTQIVSSYALYMFGVGILFGLTFFTFSGERNQLVNKTSFFDILSLICMLLLPVFALIFISSSFMYLGFVLLVTFLYMIFICILSLLFYKLLACLRPAPLDSEDSYRKFCVFYISSNLLIGLSIWNL